MAASEELQLAVQLVLFRQLAIALQFFIHFMWLSHHFDYLISRQNVVSVRYMCTYSRDGGRVRVRRVVT